MRLRNVRTERPSRTLDSCHAKYVPYAYRLDVPTGVHNVFHTTLLRPASNNPFPSQRNDDYQPPAEIIEGEPEYQVERILDEQRKRVGRGYRHEYLVKWVGHERPTWNPAVYMEDTEALEAWISLQQREGGNVAVRAWETSGKPSRV